MHAAGAAALRDCLVGLPFVNEVADGLDFRAVTFSGDVSFLGFDLSGARFDDADLSYCAFADCGAEGAVFDRVKANRVSFGKSFPKCSFVKAKLRSARFLAVYLRDADLSHAALQSATLTAADCSGASFKGANLKVASLGEVNFVGADLSDARFAEAAMGGVRFDNATRIDNADFTGARMDQDLTKFVTDAGAPTFPGQNIYELALLDATVDGLKNRNRDHGLDALIVKVSVLREQIVRDPKFDWNGVLEAELTDDELDVVIEAFEEAGDRMEDFI